MTPAELKAFVAGISYAFYEGAPNAEQWAVIKEKIDSLQDQKSAPSTLPNPLSSLSYPYATSTADAVRRAPDDRG